MLTRMSCHSSSGSEMELSELSELSESSEDSELEEELVESFVLLWLESPPRLVSATMPAVNPAMAMSRIRTATTIFFTFKRCRFLCAI